MDLRQQLDELLHRAGRYCEPARADYDEAIGAYAVAADLAEELGERTVAKMARTGQRKAFVLQSAFERFGVRIRPARVSIEIERNDAEDAERFRFYVDHLDHGKPIGVVHVSPCGAVRWWRR